MNLPETIYSYLDKALLPILNTAVPRDVISRRLAMEESHFGEEKLKHLAMLLTTIHQRASSMIGHLSIMLALCTYILNSSEGLRNHPLLDLIVSIDALIYVVLVLLTVRCLRSFGLDEDYKTKESYLGHIEKELTTKYSIIQLVNSVAILATIFLVIGFGFSLSHV